MNTESNCSYGGDLCSTILPGGIDLCVDHNVCKVRADVTVDRVRNVLIWGCVTDCGGAPVDGALVKLLSYVGCGDDLQEIVRTYTDCRGRYQFDLENSCEGRYRVLVSQPTCSDACAPLCPPPCPKSVGPQSYHYHGSSSEGCRSVSKSNVQYY